MGSSSDEEFGWTNTSNDDSDTEPEKTYDGESESGKNFKKKLQKELFQNGESQETPHERKKLENPKREESSSLSPSPRRVKRESLANGHDESAAAEHILKMKIKQEKAGFAVPRGSPRKRRASVANAEPEPEPEPEAEQPRKKKKKRDKERDEQESSATEAAAGPAAEPAGSPVDAASDEPAERSAKSSESPKKKKHKKKTVIQESSNDQDYFDGWWKFEAEETIVQERWNAFTSKEFVNDDDSPEVEPPAPAPVQPRAGPSDAKHVESPRRARMSDRITYEEESQSETGSKTRKESQSKASTSPRRPRLSERITFEEDSQSGPEPPAAAPNITQRKSLPVERRRISERITFEESASEPEPRAAEDSGRLGRFLRAHAHMHPVLGDFPPGAAITADDDIWIVRCPRDLPVSALKGITLDLDFKSKVKIGGQAYEATPAASAEGGERVAVLAPAARGKGFCVRSVPVRGSLRLRARLPRPPAPPHADADCPERIPLPDTRARHPLLGADFERALPAAVRRRLAAARARARARADPDELGRDVRREKKKKKKKHKERPELEPDPEPVVEPEPEQKKRKRKHSSRHEPEPNESERDLRSPPRKKKVKKEKKEKKRRDDAAVWDSEQAIEESLFNF